MIPSPDISNILLNKLIAGREDQLSDFELEEMRALAIKLSKTSSRHHYIPQYYIKGFLGSDNLLSVYDKKRDVIKKERVGSNGIFFEKDRNTVEIDNIKISIIEDHFFSKFDAEISKNIHELRDYTVNAALSLKNQTMVNAFVIDLFWRIPITQSAFDDMYDRSTITFYDRDGNEFIDNFRAQSLKSDPVHRKMERSRMAITSMSEILSKRNPGQVFAKLWEFEQSLFLIGDYPMLFKEVPSNLNDLMLLDFFLPISSQRMFSSQRMEGLNFKVKDAYLFNALIIDQSINFICSGNTDMLVQSVKYYKELKREGLLLPLKKLLFETTSSSKEERQR